MSIISTHDRTTQETRFNNYVVSVIDQIKDSINWPQGGIRRPQFAQCIIIFIRNHHTGLLRYLLSFWNINTLENWVNYLLRTPSGTLWLKLQHQFTQIRHKHYWWINPKAYWETFTFNFIRGLHRDISHRPRYIMMLIYLFRNGGLTPTEMHEHGFRCWKSYMRWGTHNWYGILQRAENKIKLRPEVKEFMSGHVSHF